MSTGWQDRWFVLEAGTFTYFLSKETVHEGCKGSVNLAAADISAHADDPSRLAVRIPGEQHLHLKAPSPHLRQEWLVALGSAKAALGATTTAVAAARDVESAMHKVPIPLVVLVITSGALEVSEVRLYCDLLVQQVAALKARAVTQNGEAAPGESEEELDAQATLLADTCDTFIRAVEDCLTMAIPPSSPPHSVRTQLCALSCSATGMELRMAEAA